MRSCAVILSLALLLGAEPAFAQGNCTGFKWDVSKEVELFAGTGVAIEAGKIESSVPAIEAGRLYRMQLLPQSTVAFVATPGKNIAAEGVYAGMAVVKLPAAGNYRVAVDSPLWIDVVAEGRLASVTDFQGNQVCDGPHKIVEFEIGGAKKYMLQLSGAAKATVRLTITKTPARTL